MLQGERLPVLVRRDDSGALEEIWLLTEAEYARLADARGGPKLAFSKLLAQMLNERAAR